MGGSLVTSVGEKSADAGNTVPTQHQAGENIGNTRRTEEKEKENENENEGKREDGACSGRGPQRRVLT